MSDPDAIRHTLKAMAVDRREAEDRRDVPRGGRRRSDRLLSAREVLVVAQQEEFVALDVLARALRFSRKVLLRDWESRHFPMTVIGRSILLPASYVLRAYFPHAEPSHSSHSGHSTPHLPT